MNYTSWWARAGLVVLACFVILAGTQGPVQAQTTNVAEISGTVTDPSGAAIAGAQITVTETDQQIAHATTSDSSGRYSFLNLPVGPYRLNAKMQGFKDYLETGIVLVVNNNIEINVAMQVGAATQHVEVQARSTMVETRETSVSSVVDGAKINELPMNTRQATQLVLSLGAAQYADSGDTGSKTFWNATRISVAGGQGNGTAYLLDGGDATDAMSNVNMPFPFPDALEEFSVETSAVSSRFGTHPGATVNVVTKSGANAIHGDAFEYLRNGDLDARNFFNTIRDNLKQNQFGGVIGGKIIPDKLFYFGGYQGTRRRTAPLTASSSHIPTAAMVEGNFTAVAAAACQSNGKPLTLAAPFVGNMISPTSFDPAAAAMVQKYIVPIQGQITDNCGTITYAIPQTGDENEYITRVDYARSAKNNMYGRWFGDAWTNPPVFTDILTTTSPGNLEFSNSATFGDTYTISSGMLNSFHLTYNRIRDNRGPTSSPASWTGFGAQIYSAVPNFLLISGMTGGFTSYCGTCAPGHFNVTQQQVANDFNWIKGRHEMSFGFNIIRIQNNTISGFDENGAPTWSGTFTGLGMADFMLGEMSDFQQTNATPDDLRQWVMSFYAQDSFKFSRHLTFNYGIRWEPTFADPDKYKRGTSFSYAAFLADQVSTLHPSAPPGLFFPGDPGIPPANWNGSYPNFAPRVGLVWDPSGNGKDTLRLGGALLYDQAETWFNERETTNPPYGNDIDLGATGTKVNSAGLLSNPWANYVGGNPFPQHGNLFFPAEGTYINFPINPPPTYMIQYNVTYQRQLSNNWVWSVSYMGNETTHLWIAHESDPAMLVPGEVATNTAGCSTKDAQTGLYPLSCVSNQNSRRLFVQNVPAYGADYASVDTMDPGAVARYGGFLTSVTHRLSQNFTAIANLTDAECRSDYDFGAALAGSTNSQRFNRQADWGRCISDTRIIFNLSGVVHSPWNLANPVATRLVHGWELAPLLHASSGQPLNITRGVDNSLSGIGDDRPDYNYSQALFATSHNCSNTKICYQFINPSAFLLNPQSIPTSQGGTGLPSGTYGSVARNGVRGPKMTEFDLAVARMFKLNERFNLEARFEAFNIVNHPNFVGQFAPSGQEAGASYGTLSQAINSSNFGQATGAFDPRILQFALKVHF